MVLLGAASLAVGMFASSLVKHPFLAVIVTAVMVGMLELCWFLGGKVDPPLGEVIAFLSPHAKHFRPFARGMFQLSDLVYYASIIYLSLLAATRVLKSQRWQ
jgi:ABC-2 type transport system permease protein